MDRDEEKGSDAGQDYSESFGEEEDDWRSVASSSSSSYVDSDDEGSEQQPRFQGSVASRESIGFESPSRLGARDSPQLFLPRLKLGKHFSHGADSPGVADKNSSLASSPSRSDNGSEFFPAAYAWSESLPRSKRASAQAPPSSQRDFAATSTSQTTFPRDFSTSSTALPSHQRAFASPAGPSPWFHRDVAASLSETSGAGSGPSTSRHQHGFAPSSGTLPTFGTSLGSLPGFGRGFVAPSESLPSSHRGSAASPPSFQWGFASPRSSQRDFATAASTDSLASFQRDFVAAPPASSRRSSPPRVQRPPPQNFQRDFVAPPPPSFQRGFGAPAPSASPQRAPQSVQRDFVAAPPIFQWGFVAPTPSFQQDSAPSSHLWGSAATRPSHPIFERATPTSFPRFEQDFAAESYQGLSTELPRKLESPREIHQADDSTDASSWNVQESTGADEEDASEDFTGASSWNAQAVEEQESVSVRGAVEEESISATIAEFLGSLRDDTDQLEDERGRNTEAESVLERQLGSRFAFEDSSNDDLSDVAETRPPPGRRRHRVTEAELPSTSSKDEGDQKLRFADTEADEGKEKVGAKRGLRFAEPDAAPAKQPRIRFAEDAAKSRRAVKFTNDTDDEPVMKAVRFVVPIVDSMGRTINQVYYPGHEPRKRRGTIKETTVDIYPDPPLSLVLQLMDYERFKHFTAPRRALAFWVFSRFATVVSILALVVCFILLFIYLHLHPQIPSLSMDSLDYLNLWVEQLDSDYLAKQQLEDLGIYYNYICLVDGVFWIRYKNFNSHFDIFNDYVAVTVMYKGVDFGRATVTNVMVRRGDDAIIMFVLFEPKPLELIVGYTLNADVAVDRYEFIFEIEVKGRMIPSFITSKLIWTRTRCDVVLNKIDIETGKCEVF